MLIYSNGLQPCRNLIYLDLSYSVLAPAEHDSLALTPLSIPPPYLSICQRTAIFLTLDGCLGAWSIAEVSKIQEMGALLTGSLASRVYSQRIWYIVCNTILIPGQMNILCICSSNKRVCIYRSHWAIKLCITHSDAHQVGFHDSCLLWVAKTKVYAWGKKYKFIR